jgi:hypothetical protein
MEAGVQLKDVMMDIPAAKLLIVFHPTPAVPFIKITST